MRGANAQTIRRIEQAYHDRSGCQLTADEVVYLSFMFDIADLAGIAADLDADENETIELSGGGGDDETPPNSAP